MQKCYIYGAGATGKIAKLDIESKGYYQVLGFIDDGINNGQLLFGLEVYSFEKALSMARGNNITIILASNLYVGQMEKKLADADFKDYIVFRYKTNIDFVNFIKNKLLSFGLKYGAPILKPILTLILKLLKPYRKVYFGYMRTDRIGHLAANTALFWKNIQQDKNSIHWLLVDRNRIVANEFLLSLWKRKIRIIDNVFITVLLEKSLAHSEFWRGIDDPYYLLPKDDFIVNNELLINLTQNEVKEGFAALKAYGYNSNCWHVCIFNRDEEYLKKEFAQKDFSYHSYRNSDIDSFVDAVQYIVDNGGWVFRVGKDQEKKMSFSHSRFVDYSFSNLKNDFMDIFLLSTCRFVLGDVSGATVPAMLFQKPVYATNYAELYHISGVENYKYIPKKFFSKELQRCLTLREFYNLIPVSKASYSGCYMEHDVQVLANTPEEILDFAKEAMGELLDENQNEVYKKLDQEYEDILDKYIGKFKRAKIGTSYLLKNNWLVG